MPKRKLIEAIADVEIDVVEAAEGEKAKVPTFDSVAYTGGLLNVRAYNHPIVIDLQGLTYDPAIVANIDHDPKQRVGHVTDKVNDGRTLRLRGEISSTSEAASEVIESSENNFPWKISVEADPTTRPERINAGQTVQVNGQTFTGPIYVARKSRLYGLAFLSKPADRNTSVTIAASSASGEKDMKFEEFIEASHFTADDLTDEQRAFLRKTYDAQIEAAKATGKEEKVATIEAAKFDIDELKVAAAKHDAKIEAAFFKAGDIEASKLAEIKAAAMEKSQELKREAIEKEWSGMEFQVHAIDAASKVEMELLRAERPTGPAIHASTNDYDGKAIEAAIHRQTGLPELEKKFDEKTLESAAKLGNYGLHRMLIEAAAKNGYQARPGEGVTRGNIREVMRYAFHSPDIHAASSTNSVSGILSNIANKELLSGYMEDNQEWRQVSQTRPVSDFKTHTSYRLLDNMEYEQLGKDGTIKHGTLGEESYTRSADTYAKMAALTRQDIINDDLGAFQDIRNRLGRGAAKKFNNLFWGVFMNNASFFTAGRGNFIDGADSALTDDGTGLQKGITAFRKLRSSVMDGKKRVSGERAGGRPELLIVPPELEFVAERLFVSANIQSGTTTSIGGANIHFNKYRPLVVDWLSDADFTGNSPTQWYLFRTPSDLPCVVVSFLNGMESPTVESADANFNQLGVEFRGYHDFGADLAEYLCGIKSKGAA